jgi:hypothetical protein
MTSATRTRAPNARARTTPIGTGELHQALETARDRVELARFCDAHVCTPDEVSADGTRLHLPRVLQLMRDRGYQVANPVQAPMQPKRGLTAWIVHIRMPKVEFDMGFYTPDAPAKNPLPLTWSQHEHHRYRIG